MGREGSVGFYILSYQNLLVCRVPINSLLGFEKGAVVACEHNHVYSEHSTSSQHAISRLVQGEGSCHLLGREYVKTKRVL